MSFAGNLKTVSFGDVLQLLSTGKKSGTLILERPHRGKKIFFRGGDIIAASSAPPSDEERLGQLLLRRGQLTSADLERALKRQRSTGRRLGQVLVDLGILGRDVVTAALRAQVEEIVYGVFGWPDGEFRFVEGEAPEPTQILVELNTLNAMMEGARRFDEYAEVASTLPAENTVLRISQAPNLTTPELVLTAEDVDVLSAVNGTRSVTEVVTTSTYGEYAASRSLHKLLAAQLIEPCPGVTDSSRQRAEEEETYALIHKVYTHALDSVHKTMVEYLGSSGERLFYRLPEACPADPWQITAALIDTRHAKSPDVLRERADKIPAPVRWHRLLTTASGILGMARRALVECLGARVADETIADIQKELAFLLAQKRAIAEKFDIQTEFAQALKGSELC